MGSETTETLVGGPPARGWRTPAGMAAAAGLALATVVALQSSPSPSSPAASPAAAAAATPGPAPSAHPVRSATLPATADAADHWLHPTGDRSGC